MRNAGAHRSQHRQSLAPEIDSLATPPAICSRHLARHAKRVT